MTTWILTIGSSDVLLKSDRNWNSLERQAQAKTRDLPHFRPSIVKMPNGADFFAFPVRALGIVYSSQLETYSSDLCLPRLETLCGQFRTSYPEHIIILLTDQAHLQPAARRKTHHAYWQDTCELKPILEFYLNQKFPDVSQDYLIVRPEPQGETIEVLGLDHWDSTLSLIQALMADIDDKSHKTIYVSHQGGIPALSSAVQFVTLTKFADKVQFLVSNEFQENSSELISSSTYLRGIRLQEAKRLLLRHDYVGVQELLRHGLLTSDDPLGSKIDSLLNSAILWNQAQFKQFSESLPLELQERTQEWWWAGYESAYLAMIRLEQGNTVEALFHSFRAAEGMLSNWAKWYYPDDIKEDKKGAPIVFLREDSHLPDYLKSKLAEKREKNKEANFMLYSQELFNLFQAVHPDASENENVKVIWKGAKGVRNQQFHRLLGLNEKEVFRAWGCKENRKAWEDRLLNCLNFIAGQDFKSLKDSSLMSRVQAELWGALNSVNLP
ncbi:hypothetical protein XM38_021530 [Halomicronema hongdechloris C2206]|uniref:CRISPR-associated protein n=1 Tax=Halomicronema hongdechloris C2206 TaxID=1641165 RepID=A0A1Z3HLM1_9CYAN|nr:hypothetical protein [Halomicronema hongdechloris]ASC71201.1 hypothetical protein XM38_021530 [Halomicronema hongdechloris C2206]